MMYTPSFPPLRNPLYSCLFQDHDMRFTSVKYEDGRGGYPRESRSDGGCPPRADPPFAISLTRGLTLLLICEQLSPFGAAATRRPAAPRGGHGIGNFFADCRSRTRGQALSGSIVCCPLFRVASARKA